MSESVHVAVNVYINWHFYIYFVIIKTSIPVKQLTTFSCNSYVAQACSSSAVAGWRLFPTTISHASTAEIEKPVTFLQQQHYNQKTVNQGYLQNTDTAGWLLKYSRHSANEHFQPSVHYKIVFNIVRLRFSDFFVFSPLFIRGHPYKLHVHHAPVNVRRNVFACRVVRSWNSLPSDSTDFGSLTHFRNSLHHIDFSSFLAVD